LADYHWLPVFQRRHLGPVIAQALVQLRRRHVDLGVEVAAAEIAFRAQVDKR
jgi:hypothetical protein